MSEDGDLYLYDDDYEYVPYDDYYSVELAVTKGIIIYTSPVFLLLGTVGNVLSLVVMVHLSQRVLSTCIYLVLLALIDLLVLYTRCGNEWLVNIANTDLSDQLMVTSDVICKVYPFVISFIFHAARWLLVATAIEGFIATRYPEKVVTMCTLSRAKAVIMLLIVLLVTVNIHFFWSFEIVPFNVAPNVKYYYCTFAKIGHQHSEMFQKYIWPVLDLLVAEVMPYILVIVCAVNILRNLLQGTHKGDDAHQRWRQRYELNPAAMDEMKVTILALCCFYVLFTLPKFTFSLYHNVTTKAMESNAMSTEKTDLARAICTTFEYVFMSFKFVIYFFTSHQFKVECFKALRKCTCCFQKLRQLGMKKRLLGDDQPCEESGEGYHASNKQTSAENGNTHITSEFDHMTVEQHHLLGNTADEANLCAGESYHVTARGNYMAGLAAHTASEPYRMTPALHHVTSSPHHVTSDPYHVTSSSYHVTADPYHVSSDPHHVTSSPHHMTSDLHHVTSSPYHVTSSPHHVTSPLHHVTSSPHHMTSDPHHMTPELPHHVTCADSGVRHSPNNFNCYTNPVEPYLELSIPQVHPRARESENGFGDDTSGTNGYKSLPFTTV